MPLEGERILPYSHVVLKLPSGLPKIIKIVPDTTISLGKFGSFPANSILHRPYNLTFDILDPPATGLRIVPTSEVTRDILGGLAGDTPDAADETHYDLAYDTPGDGSPSSTTEATEIMRTNRETFDDPLAQKLTWDEIEELKKSTSGNSGRDLIQRLLEGHSALHQKTPFSLQKYTLRKTSKFLRRFSVHPVTVMGLCDYVPTQKEPTKILEMRNEHLGLMLSLANVVYGGRYLIIDETGGLLVAAVAERLGLLDYTPNVEEPEEAEIPVTTTTDENDSTATTTTNTRKPRPKRNTNPPYATKNTITLLHANEQPNISLLKNFSYDTNTPDTSHPLHRHLKTINYLQLLAPEQDPTLHPPAEQTPEELLALKPGKRSVYHRKVKRWERTKAAVDDTRQGEFDAVLIAGHIGLPGLLKAVVPLVRGSGQVVAYTPNMEMATEVADLYSSARKAAWMQRQQQQQQQPQIPQKEEQEGAEDLDEEDETPDPTLLLAPTLHRTSARKYQVLPGRTHPVMTSRGGSEGIIFHAVRVLPVAGHVDARGKFRGQRKRRREENEVDGAVKKVEVGGKAEEIKTES